MTTGAGEREREIQQRTMSETEEDSMRAYGFTVAALKKKLSALGLSIAGHKAELVAHMMEADPSGAWMDDRVNNDNIGDEDVQRTSTSSVQPAVDRL